MRKSRDGGVVLLDTHLHLDQYTHGFSELLSEIRRRRVFSIAVAMDPRSYALTCSLAADEPLVLPAYGIHPTRAPSWAGHLDQAVEGLASVALVGAIGLDHDVVADPSEYPAQQAVFEGLLEGAVKHDLLVNLHTKAAEGLVTEAIRRHGVRRSIVHRYAGPVRAFRALVDLGAYFSVGAAVLRDDTAREIAAEVPLDRLLTETDNPLAWRELSGAEGRPALVIDIQRELARIRDIPVRELQSTVIANFERLIDGDARLEEPYRRAAASFT